MPRPLGLACHLPFRLGDRAAGGWPGQGHRQRPDLWPRAAGQAAATGCCSKQRRQRQGLYTTYTTAGKVGCRPVGSVTLLTEQS